MNLLEGRVAIVTGAGRGIGRATALALAAEGAAVVVNDLGCGVAGDGADRSCAESVASEIRALGGSAEPDAGDVAVSDSAAALVELALSRFGRLDVLINNAGVGTDTELHRLEIEHWQRAMDIQLGGSFHMLKAAARHMKKAGGGSIVNTTSWAGLRGNWGQAHTAAAAAGVIGLTRTASIELQKFGVRVNAIAPIAKTRLTAHLPMFEQVDSMRPEHIAPVHVFLASDLSRDVSGSLISAAGGRLSVFRLTESQGALKEEDGGIWGAHEIAAHWPSIARM